MISFPAGTEMFQFPAFALLTLYIQVKSTCLNLRSSTAQNRRQTGQGPARSGRLHEVKTTKQLTIEDCQVGFPIRTSRDQRVLSPPPGLSQSATSFIASCCQGIHQTPLSRLIRSRRRRALLHDGGSNHQPFPYAWIRSLDPGHPLGRRRPVQQALNAPKGRQSSRSVSLDLERLSWLSLDRARRRSRVRTLSPRRTRGRVRTPTRAGPRTSRVLLSSRCQVAGCRHPACQLVDCRDLAIGQEGSRP